MADDKVKMIIADDSLANRMILYDDFKLEFEVLLAANGIECLDLLAKNPDTAIILLDLVMPAMDGFGVMKNMLADENLCSIPVIAITASDSTEDFVLALDMGAYDVVAKPVNIPILHHKIWNLLARTSDRYSDTAGDIIKRRAENSEVDEKTGIYNKRTFIKKTRELLNANVQKKYVIVHIDIDEFKILNDVYGVKECDRVLTVIAESFAKLRPQGDMVYGRWEADHFVMCLELDDFHRLHITENMSSPLKGYFDFEISLRMGVYIIDDISLDVNLMCDRAMLAIKSIKNNYSKHVAFYDESMRTELIEKQQVSNEMRNALETNQFVVYFQPQYNYATQTLHGAEALVRWIHPTKGLIPPIKFIPVFEQNGFITHLDQYVWEEVCRYQRRWMDAGFQTVPISVNVSRTDIFSLRLAEYFTRLVEKYNLPTSAIRIEITESAYIDTPEQLVAAVEKLREAGFAVEMDDFGSGYSSLNSLKDVPVDMLKLDLKFIDEDGVQSKGGSILSSVVRMSNWLQLPVLAEGVETRNQAEYLKSIGCVYMQGYYFAKPMPAADFEKVLCNGALEIAPAEIRKSDIDDAMEFLNASTQATLLFNSFVGGAAIIEYDGHNVEAIRINDKFFETVETSREFYMNNCGSLMNHFDQINREKFIKTLERAIAGHEECSCELCSTQVHPGRETWTRARVRLLASNVDKYLFYLSIENISQRMNLLVSNLRLTDQLTTIINNVPGGIADFEIDDKQNLKLLYFNDKLPLLFGYTRDEFYDEFCEVPLKCVYPEDLDAAQEARKAIYEGTSNTVTLRFRHLCKDGSWKWVEFNAGKTRRQFGHVYASATVIDMDSKIKAEQKVISKEREAARKQKLYDAMFDAIPYGILQLTYTMGRYEFFDCNDNAYRILGFEDKEHLRNALILSEYKLNIPDGGTEEMMEAVERVLQGHDGDSAQVDFSVKKADGSTVRLHNVIQKIVCNNEIEYIQHMFIPQ